MTYEVYTSGSYGLQATHALATNLKLTNVLDHPKSALVFNIDVFLNCLVCLLATNLRD